MARLWDFVWNLVFGRLVPLVVFAILAAAAAWSATVAQAAAGESFYGTVHFVGQLAGFFFFAVLAISYFVRLPRRAGKRSVLVVLVAFGPFAIMWAAGTGRAQPGPLDVVGTVLVAVGLTYALASLAYLRASFSILPEARALVTGGPFAFSRHPVYLGEAIAAAGVVLPFGAARLLALVPLLACQAIRIRWEEEVLAAEFPEYADYAKRVPRYLPFLV